MHIDDGQKGSIENLFGDEDTPNVHESRLRTDWYDLVA